MVDTGRTFNRCLLGEDQVQTASTRGLTAWLPGLRWGARLSYGHLSQHSNTPSLSYYYSANIEKYELKYVSYKQTARALAQT